MSGTSSGTSDTNIHNIPRPKPNRLRHQTPGIIIIIYVGATNHNNNSNKRAHARSELAGATCLSPKNAPQNQRRGCAHIVRGRGRSRGRGRALSVRACVVNTCVLGRRCSSSSATSSLIRADRAVWPQDARLLISHGERTLCRVAESPPPPPRLPLPPKYGHEIKTLKNGLRVCTRERVRVRVSSAHLAQPSNAAHTLHYYCEFTSIYTLP